MVNREILKAAALFKPHSLTLASRYSPPQIQGRSSMDFQPSSVLTVQFVPVVLRRSRQPSRRPCLCIGGRA
jgi:hypothetical protein